MLEKFLKKLEFGIKTSRKALESAWNQIRCLKVLESPWKVLEFKSYKCWNFPFVDSFEASTCMHVTSTWKQYLISVQFCSAWKVHIWVLKSLNFVLWVCCEPRMTQRCNVMVLSLTDQLVPPLFICHPSFHISEEQLFFFSQCLTDFCSLSFVSGG